MLSQLDWEALQCTCSMRSNAFTEMCATMRELSKQEDGDKYCFAPFLYSVVGSVMYRLGFESILSAFYPIISFP